MKIPKYAQEMMSRSRFDRSFQNSKSNPGYTIIIRKATPQTMARTLRAECDRLVEWAKRNYADAEVLECPSKTHYCNQAALVTVTDPCMKYLEQYMK